MQRTEHALVVLLLAAALAGCGAAPKAGPSPGRGSQPETDDQRAAALQVKLGQGYLSQGELETALDKLRRALELDPGSADAHTLMGVLHERINRPSIAEQHYRKAAQLKPEDGGVNNNYGTFLCSTGRYEEAHRHFERAVQDPFYRTPAVAYANAAFCALKGGNATRAEQMLRSTIELDPKNSHALYELARLHFERGDFMRARAFLQRHESVTAVDAEALHLGERIEQGIGNREAAARYRQQLQERFPDFTPAATHDGTGSR